MDPASNEARDRTEDLGILAGADHRVYQNQDFGRTRAVTHS